MLSPRHEGQKTELAEKTSLSTSIISNYFKMKSGKILLFYVEKVG